MSSKRPGPFTAAAGIFLLGLIAAAPAVAQVPPGATPGSNLPELPPRRPPPSLEGPAGAFPIPPAVERPLDVEEGDRLFVKQFRLTGAAERLREGVSLKEASDIVETLRVQRQGLSKVGGDGFTDPERGQIIDFMQKVVTDPSLDMGFEEYQALVDQLRALRAQRDAGLTIGQMQQIAAAVTEYYRSAGYILAQAFIPAQEVVDGVVEIEVLDGNLGSVLAEGNKRYSDEILAAPFEDLIDAPVTAKGIEEAILLAGDYPGVTLFGVFQPGRQVGSSDLVLRVQEEKLIDGTLRLDNHGTRFTGEKRVFGSLTVNNLPLTGAPDTLTLTALRQFDPTNAFFGEAEYERQFFNPGTSLGGSFAHNPFDVGAELAAANLSGESTVIEAYLRQSIVRSRQQNLWGKFGWRRSEEISTQNDIQITEDHLSMLTAELSFDSIDAVSRAINQARIGAAVGLGDNLGGKDKEGVAAQAVPGGRQGASGDFASNEFFKLNAALTRLQIISESQSLLIRLEGQWSNDLLTSLEQFSIGGPNSVRGYPISEFQADTGLFASAEWTLNAPGFSSARFSDAYTWGQVLRVSFFADWAFGKINDPTPIQTGSVNLSGFGAAISVNLPGTLQGRFEWARPIGGDTPSDGDNARYWFDLTYQF